MKAKLFLVAVGMICGTGISQNTFPASGNVGIGTSTPTNKLQITTGTAGASGLRLTNVTSSTATTASNGKQLSVNSSGDLILSPANMETSFFAVNTATTASSGTDWLSKMQVFGAGYPTTFTDYGGIPISRYGFNVFDLYKASPYTANDVILVNIIDRAGKERFYFEATKDETGAPGGAKMGMKDGSGNEVMKISDGGTSAYMHFPKSNSRVVIGNFGNYQAPHKLVVANGSALVEGNVIADGNVGIGTSSFTDGADSYKLAVNGAVRAHRIKVYTSWADYVFKQDYNLPTLKEVEEHIKEKGHLKDIPSEQEVLKNGIELGEMNKLLLQKVEELTLYVIDLNKQIEELKAQQKN